MAEFINASDSLNEGRKKLNAIAKEMNDKDVASTPEIVNARNGEPSLKTRLDGEHEEVTSQLAQKATKQEVEVERQRINSLSKLEEGSTTADAELMDIRIGWDGTVYSSAGDAVRNTLTPLMANEGDEF